MIIITSIITSIINQNHHLTSITLYKEAEAGAGERGRKDYHHCYQHSPVLSPVLTTLVIIITSITLYKEAEAGAEERGRKDKLEKTPGTDRLRLP